MRLLLTLVLATLLFLAAVGFLLGLFVHVCLLTGAYDPPNELYVVPHYGGAAVFAAAFAFKLWQTRGLTSEEPAVSHPVALPRWVGLSIVCIVLYGLVNFVACIAGVILSGLINRHAFSLDLGTVGRVMTAGYHGFLPAWYLLVGSNLYVSLMLVRQGST